MVAKRMEVKTPVLTALSRLLLVFFFSRRIHRFHRISVHSVPSVFKKNNS